jgi:hypothetical protein
MVYGLGFAGYLAGTFAAVLLGPRQGDTDQGNADTAAVLEEVRALRRQLDADPARSAHGAAQAGPREAPGEDAQQAAPMPQAQGGHGTPRP